MNNIIKITRGKITKIVSMLFYIVLFNTIDPSRVHASSAFDKLDVDMKWLLGGTNMADADLSSALGIIERITTYAVNVAGAFSFLVILYSAFMYATAFGEESKAEAAKKTLTWSIVGMVAIIFVNVIMRIVNIALQ